MVDQVDKIIWSFEGRRYWDSRRWPELTFDWVQMPIGLMEVLERNFQNSITVFTVEMPETFQDLGVYSHDKTIKYLINLDDMTQMNTETGRVRRLKRFVQYNWRPSKGLIMATVATHLAPC